jgi:hypothetical protein
MTSPNCLCACPPYKLLNQLIGFYEIQQGGHAIESDLDTILFNLISSTILKWWTFQPLRWMQLSMWCSEILYADRFSKDEQLLIRPHFIKKAKIRTWRPVEV